MSILIIALPRTGSTSLLNRLSTEKNLKPLFEPFDGTERVMYNNEKDVVLKTIICHHPNNLELSKGFDEVILLSRKNLNDCLESHAYHTYFSRTKNYVSHNPYFYEKPPEDIFNLCYNDIMKWDIEMKELSKELNVPITYYEDIYDPNSGDRLRKGNKDKNNTKLI